MTSRDPGPGCYPPDRVAWPRPYVSLAAGLSVQARQRDAQGGAGSPPVPLTRSMDANALDRTTSDKTGRWAPRSPAADTRGASGFITDYEQTRAPIVRAAVWMFYRDQARRTT